MRRRFGVLLGCVLVVLGVVVATTNSASADSSGFTTSYQTIPGDGGTPLHGFVITPTGPGTFPLLVMPSSWGAPDLEYVGAGAKLAYQDGYEVISYTSRGFYDSGGGIDVAGAQTMADVSKVIDWALANTPADATKIGVAGISYGAGQALLAAGLDPRIKAVAAMDGWTDLAESLYPSQTVSGLAADGLIAAANVTGRPAPDLRQIEKDYAAGDIKDILPLAATRSAINEMPAINRNGAAVMIANDWEDSIFPPSQLVTFYDQLTGAKRLLLEPGDHGTASGPGAIGLPNDVWDAVAAWFDHYLRGIDNGVNTDDPIQLKPANGGSWEGYADWNAVTAAGHRYYLTGPSGIEPTGSLADSAATGWKSGIGAGVDTIADSGVPFVTGALQEYANLPVGVSIPLVARGLGAVWSGPSYPDGLAVTGAPVLHTTVTPSAANTSLFAYLYDVDGFGTGSLITSTPFSVLNASPGQAQSVDIALQPISWIVPSGHHLALVVDTMDPRYTSVSSVGSSVSFSSPAGNPSTLTITGS